MRQADAPKVRVSRELLVDIRNIANGVFSPLEGFLGQEDFDHILYNKRLANGLAWTVPIVLDVTRDKARELAEGQEVVIVADAGRPVAIFHLREKYVYNKEEMAKKVYGTTDLSHPGVARIKAMGEVLLGGEIDLIEEASNPYERFTLEPAETRVLFRERGWRTVTGFQTRNVPHRGHESLQKMVLGLCDGLLIHPIIGKKKAGDFKDEVILKAYEALIQNYFPPERIVLSALLTEMRYAGPREAIHHAIIRKNFGCTHFVVGRDHAGVGDFYDKEAAIEIFDEFEDLEISPIAVKGDFFHCNICGGLMSERTCPHSPQHHIPFSGTTIRNMLAQGKEPPAEVMRPEVFQVLSREENPFV